MFFKGERLIVVPLYQNLLNLFFTLMLMVFYTLSVNSPNEKGNIDLVEGALFTFALGFFFDEITKMCLPSSTWIDSRYKNGIFMMGFWNVYNVPHYLLSTLIRGFLI